MNPKLTNATAILRKVVEGENLSALESEQVFGDIFRYDTEGYHLIALVAAIHAKGETAEELLGFCRTSSSLGVKILPKVSSDNITDLAGTGGSKIKTINVSTAASFIVAAAGVVVAKHAGYAVTSPTGSGDIFRAFGIDTFKLSVEDVNSTLEEIGISPYYLSAMSPKLANRSKIAKKVFVDMGVGIGSPFHIAAFAYSPTQLKRRIYGCYDEKYLEVLGELFTNLGNERTLILHGVGGIPEASNIGDTVIVEQLGKKIKRYVVKPSDFGLNKSNADEIRTGGKEQNIIDFLRILYGKEDGAKRDIVLANASASLFVMDKVDSLKKGTSMAIELIGNKSAVGKLEELVKKLGDQKLFDDWKDKAQV